MSGRLIWGAGWRPAREIGVVRTLSGLVVGAAVGFAAVYVWQLLGHVIFPFPTTDPTDPVKREVLANMSFAAQAWVVGGYAVGVAVGGLLGNWIADARWPAMLVAIMVAGAFFATLTVAPHPFWMQVAGILLPLLAGFAVAATVGHRTLMDA
jgi:MFS family permease